MGSLDLSQFDQLQNLAKKEFETVTKSGNSLREKELNEGAYQGVCTLCLEPVFGANGVQASQSLFCRTCFCCMDCDAPLKESYFVVFESSSEAANTNPLETYVKSLAQSSGLQKSPRLPIRCHACQEQFINSPQWGVCAGCDKALTAVDEKLTIRLNSSDPCSEAVFYHPACFRCTTCSSPIAGKKYYASSAMTRSEAAASQHVLAFSPLCATCYTETLPRCTACHQAVSSCEGGESEAAVFVTINEHNYHTTCLACSTCKKVMDPNANVFIGPESADNGQLLFCSQECFSAIRV